MNRTFHVVKPPCLHDSLRTCEAVTTCLGLVLNSTLALLIIFRTEKELRQYRRVLICNCFVDTAYSLLAYIFEIHLDVRNGMYVIINNGFFVGDYQRNYYMQCFQIFMIYFTTAAVCLPMVYRYLAVCRSHRLTGPQFALLFLMIVLVSSTVPLTEAIFWHPVSERTLEEHAEAINSMACSDPGEVYLFSLMDAFSLAVAPTLLAAGSVIGSAYGVIIFCALRIKQTVAARPSENRRTRSLQKQLNCALLVQVVTPLVLFVFPIGGAVAALFSGVGHLRIFIVTCTTVLSFIPVLNPISTIFFIKSYRRTLQDIAAQILRLGTKIRPLTSASNSLDPQQGAAAAGRTEPTVGPTSTVFSLAAPTNEGQFDSLPRAD